MAAAATTLSYQNHCATNIFLPSSIEIQALVKLDNVKTHLLNFSYHILSLGSSIEDVEAKIKYEILHHLSISSNYPKYALRLQHTNKTTNLLPPHYQTNNKPIVLHLSASTHLPIRGGKGGFGTLLKGQSKRAGAKTTLDFGACRDLSGRRLRHVNDEIKLRKWRNAQYRRAHNLPVDEVEELKTASGIRNWHLMIPNWSDVGSIHSNKGKRKAERALEKEVYMWKSEEERVRLKKRMREEEEERRVEDYVREVNVRLDDENENGGNKMMDAIKMGMMAQKQKQKQHLEDMEQKKQAKSSNFASFQQEYQDENIETNQPSYLCTLSGEAVILDDKKYSSKKQTQQNEKSLVVQSQAEFTTFAILLSQTLSLHTSSSSIYYYEVTIHSMGLSQIGWALSSSSSEDGIEFNPNSDVGDGVGDDNYSYGYDASRSLSFHNGKEVPYGEKEEWKEGDTLGCIYNASTGCVSYTINGKDLGVAFEVRKENEKEEEEKVLYPALSLNHGVIVTINVGPVFEHTPSVNGKEKKDENVEIVGICELIADNDNENGEEGVDVDNEQKSGDENSDEKKENKTKNGSSSAEQDSKEESSSSSPSQVPPHSSEASTELKQNQQEEPAKSEAKKEERSFDWNDYNNASELESLGMDRLKSILLDLGVKCGGSLQERANRLFSLKGLKREEYPKKVRGKNFVV